MTTTTEITEILSAECGVGRRFTRSTLDNFIPASEQAKKKFVGLPPVHRRVGTDLRKRIELSDDRPPRHRENAPCCSDYARSH
ncbi:hypothetical protein [Dickeya oryzae]